MVEGKESAIISQKSAVDECKKNHDSRRKKDLLLFFLKKLTGKSKGCSDGRTDGKERNNSAPMSALRWEKLLLEHVS
ncbi:hypothetical protein [uncultured Mailhella sp.]|uniref:hypothetical protein n=1 Tax=uncultured Mailhella sp. TaxID=1981031 RepID=UPI00320798B4